MEKVYVLDYRWNSSKFKELAEKKNIAIDEKSGEKKSLEIGPLSVKQLA